jgi:hypothetical protein
MKSIGEFNKGERVVWLLHSRVINIGTWIISSEQENQSDLMIEEDVESHIFSLYEFT